MTVKSTRNLETKCQLPCLLSLVLAAQFRATRQQITRRFFMTSQHVDEWLEI